MKISIIAAATAKIEKIYCKNLPYHKRLWFDSSHDAWSVCHVDLRMCQSERAMAIPVVGRKNKIK